MGQAEYNAFKEQMNSQSDVDYQQIVTQAMALMSKYGKAISPKMNRKYLDDIT